jgi:Uma2 family endonuclease
LSTLPKSPLSAAEYLEIERKAKFKSEFYRGEMSAISGASRNHCRIPVRLASLIGPHVLTRGCEGYDSNMRVLVEDSGLYTYPDLSVVCDEPKFVDAETDTLTNPTLLVEVLSPSTEEYDRGTKVKLYRAIPSLRECLLISQDAPEVELYRREMDDVWKIIVAKGPNASVELKSIDYTLRLWDLYRGIIPETAASE